MQLSWSSEGRVVELQQSDDASFRAARSIYRGTDDASLRTGLPDGAYSYRARLVGMDGVAGPWSEPVSVTVAHHGAIRTWGLFGLGAVVFAATLGLILRGPGLESGDV